MLQLICCAGPSPNKRPTVVKGVIDLRGWDFETDGSIRLQGQWRLCGNDSVGQSYGSEPCRPDSFVTIMGRLPHHRQRGYGQKGLSALYRLDVFIDKKQRPLAMDVTVGPSAYRMCINGDTVAIQGKIGKGGKKDKILYFPKVVSIPNVIDSSFTLEWHVSNNLVRNPLVTALVTIGTSERLMHFRLVKMLSFAFVLGGILLIALYHFFVYIFLRSELVHLYFGFAILIAVLSLTVFCDNILHTFMPGIPLFFSAWMFINLDPIRNVFLWLMGSELFPKEFQKRFLPVWIIFAGATTLAGLLAPSLLLTERYIGTVSAATVLFSISGTLCILLALKNKRNRSLHFFFATAIFAMLGMHDAVLVGLGKLHMQLYPYGLCFFVVIQTFLMAKAYGKAQFETQKYRENLANVERLTTLGTVVASVAHEINNPNNALLLDAQITEKVWKNVITILDERSREIDHMEIGGYRYEVFKEKISALADRMKRNAGRIKSIIDDLHSLVRKNPRPVLDIDINAAVTSALTVIEQVTAKYTRDLRLD
ncbi:MAG: hypothetical protein JW795_13970, partial [Chitinivibrionales bacterium]|nr:hypothetical protein [Chitinivibrionales bacterium]